MSFTRKFPAFCFIALIAPLFWLSGCQNQPSEPEVLTVQKPRPKAPDIPQAQLFRWLDEADAAIKRDHLTYPETGSAFAIYKHILNLQPDQPDALRGLEQIVENYMQMALSALDQRRFAAARSYLKRARLILPDHTSIEPTARQIRLIMEADREVLTLQQTDLRQETKETVEALRQLGNYAAGKNCRFSIAARSDSQGRWLYQKLAEGAAEQRLKASMVIRLPASVERLCFKADT